MAKELLYKDLTYKIRGVLFKVHNELGPVHKEKVYQRAVAKELKNQELVFEREKRISVFYDNEAVGTYVPDFIIDDKVILEIKAVPCLNKQMQDQVWYYIRSTKYRLVLLANFGTPSLEVKRRIYDHP